ncbi:MAG: DUF4384 domain-containing protein [Planctomycetaceae bacterium]|nr:DUF4384 domain-containing protein [Planctomycetaceae bacterium]
MKSVFSAIVLLILPLTGFAVESGDELDQEVIAIFKQKCTVCHDDRPGDSGGTVQNLLDLKAISHGEAGYIDESEPGDSYLATIIREDQMPLPKWKDDIIWAGPLSAAQKATVLKWIERGGASESFTGKAREDRQDISEQQITETIADDLLALDGATLKNARYLTLTNLHNRDTVSKEELDLYREGMVKMLNSVSRSSDVLGMPDAPAVNRVVAVDRDATIYRFDLRDIGWESGDWERIIRHYPYGLIHRDGAGKSIGSLTDSSFPLARADWFVFAVSQAPLYHELLGIGSSLSELEMKLGIDRLQNIREFKVARAAFANSRVSVNNRLVERHFFTGGYYHISYDCFANTGRSNFFEFPLGPDKTFDTEFSFEFDGGEVIYSLPNGFQAYVLATSQGKRLSIAPSAVVHDDSMPAGAILNGISCISCHYKGTKPENPEQAKRLDQLREMALSNPRRFKAQDRERIDQLYPGAERFGELLEADRESWLSALQKAGITSIGPQEPVRALFDSFTRNLDLETAAAEFGLSVAAFEEKLNTESETRQLVTRLRVQGVQRQLFVEEFRKIAELSGLGEPREFELLKVPYFGHDPEAPADSAQTSAQAPTTTAAAETQLLRTSNRPASMTVSMGELADRKTFFNDETIPCRIKANEDCFVTILGIDPNGEVSCLLPNKWKHETDGSQWWSPLKLKANQTLEITPTTVGFELFAQAPHGVTTLRVIVTRSGPLKMKLDDRVKADLSSKGIPSLGFASAKGIGARPAASNQSVTNPDRPAIPGNLLARPLSETFAPNDWATAEWTFFTKSGSQ